MVVQTMVDVFHCNVHYIVDAVQDRMYHDGLLLLKMASLEVENTAVVDDLVVYLWRWKGEFKQSICKACKNG